MSIFHPEKGISATTAAQMQHYALTLAGFQYDIKIQKQEKYGNADGLSRLPIKLAQEEEDMLDTTNAYMMPQFEWIPVSSNAGMQLPKIQCYQKYAVTRGWTDVQDKELTPFYNR